MFGRWFKRGKGDAGGSGDANEPPHGLDREGDPRGGVQSDEYRHADPRDVVEEDGVAMSGPGGAPQEGRSPDELRNSQRE